MNGEPLLVNPEPPLNPWLSIWLQPRQTIRQIVDRDPGWMLWRICLLAGAANAVMRVEAKDASPLNKAIAAVLGALLSPVFLYLIGWFLRWTGSWFGGRATNPQIRAALVWSNVPALALFMLWVPIRSVFSEASPVWMVYTIAALIVTVWSVVIFIRMLAEVHSISSWKACWATGFPLVLIAVLALMLAIAIPNVIRGRTSANETAAVTRLQSLAASLEAYRGSYSEYPKDWAAFSSTKNVPPEFAVPQLTNHLVQQFEYNYEPRAGGYAISAMPGLVLSRAFFLDQTSQIRHCKANQPGERADAADRLVTEEPMPCTP